jgi:hemerythrin
MEETVMRTKKKSGSIWQESMSVGLPALDQERKNVFELLELLEVRPLYSIASEAFSSRFVMVHAAIERFIQYEESVLREYPVPDETRRLHVADHERIRTELNRIQLDSINKKNQTALDVYKSLRTQIKKHVLTFGVEISKYIPSSEAVKETV